jgi:hypothetical protein
MSPTDGAQIGVHNLYICLYDCSPYTCNNYYFSVTVTGGGACFNPGLSDQTVYTLHTKTYALPSKKDSNGYPITLT